MENTTESSEKFDDRTNTPKSRLKDLSPKKVVGEAQRIVGLATNILEEEIAAGIIAAKEIEKKVIDVDKVRDKDKDHIFTRFRSDAHEIVDILMDVVSVASTQIETLSNKVVNIIPDTSNDKDEVAYQVPVLKAEKPLDPGSETAIKMQLQNDHKENVMKVALSDTDLVTPSGGKILARNITVSPKTVTLKPGEKKAVTIKIKVPQNTKSGKYSGLLQDKTIENLQALVSVEVN